MPITVTATRDVTDAIVSITIDGSGLTVGKTYTLTINGQAVHSQKASSGTLSFTVQAAAIPAAILAILQSFCQTDTTDIFLGSGYTNDSGSITLTVT